MGRRSQTCPPSPTPPPQQARSPITADPGLPGWTPWPQATPYINAIRQVSLGMGGGLQSNAARPGRLRIPIAGQERPGRRPSFHGRRLAPQMLEEIRAAQPQRQQCPGSRRAAGLQLLPNISQRLAPARDRPPPLACSSLPPRHALF